MPAPPRRFSWRGARIGLACALAAWLLTRTAPIRGLEEWALDYCFACRGPRPSPARARIILIGLDDASLDRLDKPMALASPELAEVLTLAARGLISSKTTEFPLSRAVEAYDALKAGEVEGRAVVVPDARI